MGDLPVMLFSAVSHLASSLGGVRARRGPVKEATGGLEVAVVVYTPTMASAQHVEEALTAAAIDATLKALFGDKIAFPCRVAWAVFKKERVLHTCPFTLMTACLADLQLSIRSSLCTHSVGNGCRARTC